MQEQSQRGQIKCETEPKAFMEYKKGNLFQNKDDLIRENRGIERRELLQKTLIVHEKIAEE